MVERQDIDALLIGALYGELTPAEEKRLAAHLESHPADKVLFADLTHARELVRDSRILETQAEPPRQISTWLLQEAARRAPREHKESWFTRLVRSLVAHPAMAAAMMLVVVIGFAAIITQREGHHFAGSEKSTTSRALPAAEEAKGTFGEATEDGAEPTSAASAELAASEAEAPSAAPEQYAVTLEERAVAPVGEPAPSARKPSSVSRAGDAVATTTQKEAVAKRDTADPRRASRARKAAPVGALELRREEPQPKDLDDAYRYTGRAETKPPAQAPPKGAPVATGYAPPPPPRAPIASAGAPADEGAAAGAAPGAVAADKAADPQHAWARQQHARIVAQVRAGNCRQAAALAVSLESREPRYFAQNVATDRAVKDCMPYIQSEREKRAEQAEQAQQPQ